MRWNMGERDDGRDSTAVQLYDENYWPSLEAIILVVNAKEKETSSTEGMQTTVETSSLLHHRVKHSGKETPMLFFNPELIAFVLGC